MTREIERSPMPDFLFFFGGVDQHFGPGRQQLSALRIPIRQAACEHIRFRPGETNSRPRERGRQHIFPKIIIK